MVKQVVEGEHYYFDPDGKLVFTEKYLLERGHCCESGCRHCPYGYAKTGRWQSDTEWLCECGIQPENKALCEKCEFQRPIRIIR